MMRRLRILVVDDVEEKRRDVIGQLSQYLESFEIEWSEAAHYAAARSKLESEFFDVVILDLLLPFDQEGEPIIEASKSLLRAIRAGETVSPAIVIGLTAYNDLARTQEALFERDLLALEKYDALSTEWAEKIGNRLTYLAKSRIAAQRFHMNAYELDLVILCARHDNEYDPIVKNLFEGKAISSVAALGVENVHGDIVIGDGRTLAVCVICVGEKGMAPSAAIATQAIQMLRPRLIAMLGMCCGFSSVEHGKDHRLNDLIVVRESKCWEEGRFIDGEHGDGKFLTETRSRVVDDKLREEVWQILERSAETSRELKTGIEQDDELKRFLINNRDLVRDVPKVTYGEMVTGSSVVATTVKVKEILDTHQSAEGLDMEVYGLYTAVEKSMGSRPSVLAIKGVADFGSADKAKEFQRAASISSSILLKAILGRLSMFGE